MSPVSETSSTNHKLTAHKTKTVKNKQVRRDASRWRKGKRKRKHARPSRERRCGESARIERHAQS